MRAEVRLALVVALALAACGKYGSPLRQPPQPRGAGGAPATAQPATPGVEEAAPSEPGEEATPTPPETETSP